MASTVKSSLGHLMREWRALRGLSQLDLALEAEVSTRHVSFLETGRSSPSREMVQRLAQALELPLRERNRLLKAAGFAAQYGESSLGDAEFAPVRRALETLLRSHEPYPAFVVDRTWTILLANDRNSLRHNRGGARHRISLSGRREDSIVGRSIRVRKPR